MSVVGGLRDRVFGRNRRTWNGSVEKLLFEGESVRQSVAVGDNRVVVTSHRLLAFTPERDGENYRHVDLPNVADVRAGHRAEDGLVGRGIRALVYGGILLAVGVTVDFESIVPTDALGGSGSQAAGRVGIGSVLGLLNRFLGLVANLDEMARLFGALLLLFSTVVFGAYFLTRERVLTVAVAGDEADIAVPAAEADVERAVVDLERVLFEDGGTTDGGTTDAGTTDAGRTSGTPDGGGSVGPVSDR